MGVVSSSSHGRTFSSYYGSVEENSNPEQNSDDDLANHLPCREIPISKETIKEVVVPISINDSGTMDIKENKYTITFSATSPGYVSMSYGGYLETYYYSNDMDIKQSFKMPSVKEWQIIFSFDSSNEVSARRYKIKCNDNGKLLIVDDQIIIDGVASSLSEIYRQDNDENDGGFNDEKCLICCSAKANVVVYPCRHCCMCRECSETFAKISCQCPVCRTIVEELIEVEDERIE